MVDLSEFCLCTYIFISVKELPFPHSVHKKTERKQKIGLWNFGINYTNVCIFKVVMYQTMEVKVDAGDETVFHI